MTTINNGGPLINPQSIPPTWAVARIDECGRVQMGRQRSPIYRTGEFTKPYLRAANILDGRIDTSDILSMDFDTQDFESFRLKTGDVLVVEGGTVGRSAVYGGNIPDACFQNTVIRFQVDERLTFPKFADYLFRWYFYKGAFKDVARQTTIAHLGLTRFAGMPYVLPPLPEQRRIVEAIESNFDRLEAASASLLRCRAVLRRYRDALLHAACHGSLVPTEAELARSGSRMFVTAQAMIARLDDERLKAQRELGSGRDLIDARNVPMPEDQLPEGWAWFPWVRLAGRITVGYVGPISTEHREEGVPLIRSQNIRPCRFSAEGVSHVSRSFFESNLKNAARGGDLCVVRSGDVGTTCALPGDLGDVCVSDLVIIQRPIGILPAYGAYVMNSFSKSRIASGKVGIGLTHYNTKSVAALPVPLPPWEEQARIVAQVERGLSIADKIESTVETQIALSTVLRQAVLRSAFRGSLVPQDPTDEPASVLLERMKRERSSPKPVPAARRSKSVARAASS